VKLDINGIQEPLVDLNGNGWSSGSDLQAVVQFKDGEGAARSAENIMRWRSYLPEDCVTTMVRMGWDQTT